MACYHPILAIDTGTRNSDTGGVYYHFKQIPPDYDPAWPLIGLDRLTGRPCSPNSPGRIQDPLYDGPFEPHRFGQYPFKLIPCGRCDGCRLSYSKQWANRCMMELESHDSAYFVTLTYNDHFVPQSDYIDRSTGEQCISLTLRKKDFQNFMKRLRFAFPDDRIRFFASGEYGDTTWRPHYHAIIFGLHLNDLVPSGKSPEGFQYYYSPSFQRCWSQQVDLLGFRDKRCPYQEMGYALVSPVTWETCAYTARYTMKKLKGAERFFYADLNLEPPFSLMSMKPGIGAAYLAAHPDCYDYSFINLSTDKGGRKVPHPRYLDKLFEVDHPEEMAVIKQARERTAKAAAAAKLQRTTFNYLEMLQVEEDKLRDRIKSLRRDSF